MRRVPLVLFIAVAAAACQIGCSPKQGANPTTSSSSPSGSSQGAAGTMMTPDETLQLIRNLSNFYREKHSFQVQFEQQFAMEAAGMKNAMESRAVITLERPNRFSLRQADAAMGAEVISDGKQLSISVPMIKQYSQSTAPETIEELLVNPLINSSGGGRGPLLDIFASDPYKTLMDGVTSVNYVGREKIGDVDTHHLKLVQAQFDWEMWIKADKQPSLVQARFDMSKAMAAAGPMFQNGKMIVTQTYKDWQFDTKLPDDAFAFVPPEGSKKIDDLLAGDDEPDEPSSPLVGKPAPDIEQELLDGSHFSLKGLKDQKVVILDFWATWCGPCVQEMPIIAKVADEYRDKDVALYCVNQREDAGKIRKFLDQKSLNVTVSLDATGDAGDSYEVSGIPTLVLIDKAGVVQSIHVGFSPSIGDQLKRELDVLLAGGTLATRTSPSKEDEDAGEPAGGLEQVWQKQGRYTSVASAGDGKSVVALNENVAEFYDAAGDQSRVVKLAGKGNLLRSARLSGNEPGELLRYDSWTTPLTAVGPEGESLWTQGMGIDDVWVADLDRDGKDEVIVGYNGRDGVHVFNGDGERRWQSNSIGNVWHVTAGDLDGDGKLEVITTSAAGKVHQFDGQGTARQTLDPGIYGNMVRVVRLPDATADIALVIGSHAGKHAQMVALNGDGEKLWQLDFQDGAKHCDSLAIAPGSTWAAAVFRDGYVCVIDLKAGKILAVGPKQGKTAEVAWTATDASPLLVIASNDSLTAWQVKLDAGETP